MKCWAGAHRRACRRHPGHGTGHRSGRGCGRRRRPDGVRRLGGQGLHPAAGSRCRCSHRESTAEGAAPHRHPHDPGQRRKQEWLRGLVARARPGDRHRRQPGPPRLGAAGARRARVRCSTGRASSCTGPTTTSRRSCATPSATCCPTPGGATPISPSSPGRSFGTPPWSGWVDLTNRHDELKVGDTWFAFAGVDDPHLRYDRLDLVAGPADPDADVRLALASRAVPAGARPVRRPRLRGRDRRPPPARSAFLRARYHPRPRQRSRQRPAPPPRGLPRR